MCIRDSETRDEAINTGVMAGEEGSQCGLFACGDLRYELFIRTGGRRCLTNCVWASACFKTHRAHQSLHSAALSIISASKEGRCDRDHKVPPIRKLCRSSNAVTRMTIRRYQD